MPAMKLVSLNIEGHRHLEERVLPFIQHEQPDVVCLQEVFEADVPRIKSALGMEGHFVPVAQVDQTSIHMSHALGAWGLLQLSRLPIQHQSHAYYMGGPGELPSFMADGNPNGMNRVVLWVEIPVAGQIYRIATTHFIWSTKGNSTPLQLEKLEALFKILADLPDLIICGDFNAPRGKETFARLAAKYHDNIPPEVKTSLDGQFHKAGQLQLMVDGLFSTPEYQVSQVRVEGGVSDHKAIVALVEKSTP